jgi:hypothetical protein
MVNSSVSPPRCSQSGCPICVPRLSFRGSGGRPPDPPDHIDGLHSVRRNYRGAGPYSPLAPGQVAGGTSTRRLTTAAVPCRWATCASAQSSRLRLCSHDSLRAPRDGVDMTKQGRRMPGFDTVLALASALGVPCEAFKEPPLADAAPRGRGRPPACRSPPGSECSR